MKYRYTRFTGEDLEGVDLEELVSKLSDLLLASGFDNPREPQQSSQTSSQDLHDAILEALLSGGLLSQETLRSCSAIPADADTQSQLEQLIKELIERMAQRGYITPHPDLDAERMEREGGPGGAGPRPAAGARSRSPTRRSTSSATARCATCSARSARAAPAVTTRAICRPASTPKRRRSRTSSATR